MKESYSVEGQGKYYLHVQKEYDAEQPPCSATDKADNSINGSVIHV